MKLNKKTFTYKLYSLCYILTCKLFNNRTMWSNFDRDNKPTEEMIGIGEPTNLCVTIRTFIWAGLYILLLIGLISGYGYALFFLPFAYGGTVGYFNVYGVPLIVAGLVYFIAKLIMFVTKEWGSSLTPEEKRIEKEARHAAGKYTLYEVLCEYIKAGKERMCPLIEIVEDGETK